MKCVLRCPPRYRPVHEVKALEVRLTVLSMKGMGVQQSTARRAGAFGLGLGSPSGVATSTLTYCQLCIGQTLAPVRSI